MFIKRPKDNKTAKAFVLCLRINHSGFFAILNQAPILF